MTVILPALLFLLAPPRLANVEAAFHALPTKGQTQTLETPTLFAGTTRHRYTPLAANIGRHNHLQGVTFTSAGLLLSGSDRTRRQGDLIFASGPDGPLAGMRPIGSKRHAHPGGIQAAGPWLAVPVEGRRGSRLEIWKVEPAGARKIQTVHRRRRAAAAGAVLTGTGLKVAVVSTSKKNRRPKLSLYQMSKGQIGPPTVIELADHDALGVAGENIALVEQTDGQLYLLSFNRLPFTKADEAQLFKLDTNGVPTTVGRRTFECGKRCDFSAAATAMVRNGKLEIVSVSGHRSMVGGRQLKAVRPHGAPPVEGLWHGTIRMPLLDGATVKFALEFAQGQVRVHGITRRLKRLPVGDWQPLVVDEHGHFELTLNAIWPRKASPFGRSAPVSLTFQGQAGVAAVCGQIRDNAAFIDVGETTFAAFAPRPEKGLDPRAGCADVEPTFGGFWMTVFK